jgi:hypothetical protein
VEVGREERGLVAARPRADLDDRGAVVERVARDEQRLELALEPLDLGLETLLLGARFRGHVRVVSKNELADIRELVLGLLQPVGHLDDRREALLLSAERREQSGVANGLGVEQIAFDFSLPFERLGEAIA